MMEAKKNEVVLIKKMKIIDTNDQNNSDIKEQNTE